MKIIVGSVAISFFLIVGALEKRGPIGASVLIYFPIIFVAQALLSGFLAQFLSDSKANLVGAAIAIITALSFYQYGFPSRNDGCEVGGRGQGYRYECNK